MYFKRCFAYLIDASLATIPVYIFFQVFGHVNKDGEKTIKGLSGLIVFIGLTYSYYIIQEYFWSKTFGKKILKLRVVKIDNTKLYFSDLLKRHFFDILEIYFLCPIGFLVSILNKKNQRIGDLIAKTQVIEEKSFSQQS
ncbi:MAG TPA: RDD family protein [Puia sp.]|nr:RDD family protein [Puia sp.]